MARTNKNEREYQNSPNAVVRINGSGWILTDWADAIIKAGSYSKDDPESKYTVHRAVVTPERKVRIERIPVVVVQGGRVGP